MANPDLRKRYEFHTTGDEQRSEHDALREATFQAAEYIDTHVPDGREKSLALTKIEEAKFWANAAIAAKYKTEAAE